MAKTFAELKADHEAAQALVRQLNASPQAAEIRKAAADAANLYYMAERLEWGRAIVGRLVGQTIISVEPRWNSGEVEAHHNELDESVCIILSNGVEISAATSGEDEGRLEVSEARPTPQAADAVAGDVT